MRERKTHFKRLFNFTVRIIHPLIKYVDSSVGFAKESTPSMRGKKTLLEKLFTLTARTTLSLTIDMSFTIKIMILSTHLTFLKRKDPIFYKRKEDSSHKNEEFLLLRSRASKAFIYIH